MARGFGSTRGVGSTDRLATNVGSIVGARTIFIVSKRNGSGGGGFGRYWDAVDGGGGTSFDQLFYNPTGDVITYQRYMGSGVAGWTVASPSSGSWHTIGISFDGSSSANNPVIYINGTSVTVTEVAAPTGAASANAAPYWIGNRPSDSARNWDGDHAEFAIWNSILDATAHAALAAGDDPATIDSGNLILYVPLVSTLTATVGSNLTATGTAVTTHPAGFSDGSSAIATLAAHYSKLRRA